MAEAQKGNEQSMDDILASIRRIISDDPLAPNPAGTAHADGGAALMGAQAEPEAGVASSERGANGGAGLRNPTDDLSDILEPSKVPSARPGGPEPGPEESCPPTSRRRKTSTA